MIETEYRTVDGIVDKWMGRRAFAASLTAGAAGLWATSAGVEAQAITDTDILNFALNLEYLEAEFYTVVTSGRTIDQSPFNIGITGVGTPGLTTGAGQLTFSDPNLNATVQELAYDERAHVQLLRTALGSAAVAKPAIDFAPAGVTTVARFLQVARVLEDVGVSAYGGAAPLLTSRDLLGTAARIALTEALHSGNIRLHVAQTGAGNIGPIDSVDVLVGVPPQLGSRLISSDAQGLAAVRTPSQVLSIVYGPNAPAGTTAGLLFPNGVNGAIRTV